MSFIALQGGAYTARSLVAAAQRCLNLYVEPIGQSTGEPYQAAHFCTPGLTFVANAHQDRCRGAYTAYDGTLFVCYDQKVFRVDAQNQFAEMGTFVPTDPTDAVARDTPVSMSDNGQLLLIVDGSVDGWFIDLTLDKAAQKLEQINRTLNSGWQGSDFVSYQDTFFIFNKPDSAQFYISLSNIGALNLTALFNVQAATIYKVNGVSLDPLDGAKASPGKDYKVNDVLTLSNTGEAKVTVHTVDAAGAILTATVTDGGAVATKLDNPVFTTGGSGTGASFNLTYSGNPGTRYLANDVLTLTGTGKAQITVNTVDNTGAIVDYGVSDGGGVSTKPSNPVAVTGGAGTGALFDLTYTDNIGGFDGADFAAMAGQANKLVAAISVHRNLWLIGTTSYELWTNTGGDGTIQGSFPFSIYPDAYADYGCVAKYSVAAAMNQVFWLTRDKHGGGMIMRGEGGATKRISTHAIEHAISQYSTMTDAIGMIYSQQGHVFYLLTFPSAFNSRGATWCFDSTTNEWSERCYIDENGIEYRHLANAMTAAYEKVYVGDWRNGNLYNFNLDDYTDNGQPIKRLRSFPHQIDLEQNRRIMYNTLIAQMQVGSTPESGSSIEVVSADFTAADGTALEDYHNINSFGANFTPISGEADIVDDAVVISSSGEAVYSVSGTPTTPNYTTSFQMVPTNYDSQPVAGSSLFLIARANEAHNGYKAGIVSDGSQYLANLAIMGGSSSTIQLGVLTNGMYNLMLELHGTSITLYVLRTADGEWVDGNGIWQISKQAAVSIADSTYSLAGQILIGGTAGTTSPLPMSLPLVTGVEIQGAVGVIGLPPPINLSVVGQSMTAGIGNLGVSNTTSVSKMLTGVAGSGGVGALTVTSQLSASPTLTGVTGTGAFGTLTTNALPSAPPQAIAAGYSSLVFDDDFTTTSTIAPNASSVSGAGFKWYWVAQVDTYFTHVGSWSVNPTATATGSNASAHGGILTFNVQRGSFANVFWGNSVLCSIPVQTMTASSIPPNCAWQHGYVEFYAKTTLTSSPNTADPFNGGWPAVWAGPVESIANGGFGAGNSGISSLTAPGTEIDYIESQGGVFGNPAGNNQMNIEDPAFVTPGVYGLTYPVMDTAWHTYGFLWKPGSIRVYYDNVAIAAAHSTAAWNLESCNMFLIIGSGINWPLAIDWIRVWQ